jgi:hypothetical protein
METNISVLASHSSVAHGHYMDDDRLLFLRNSKIPISCHICTADKLISPSDQFYLQKMLKAKPIVFEGSGHLGAKEHWDRWVKEVLTHLLEASRAEDR